MFKSFQLDLKGEKMKKILFVCFVVLCISGCAMNARVSGLKSYGSDHSVQLYSGGSLVREWVSDGKNSDGYYFKDKTAGKLVRVTGDLVITPK